MFQLIAAIFPGTSRSGATIVGALLLGISRTVAAEYTFFLAIPVMFGASFLKGAKFLMNATMTSQEGVILVVGMVVAFAVSLVVIKFLMGYIKKTRFQSVWMVPYHSWCNRVTMRICRIYRIIYRIP